MTRGIESQDNSTGLRVISDFLEESGQDGLAVIARKIADRLAIYERLFETYGEPDRWSVRHLSLPNVAVCSGAFIDLTPCKELFTVTVPLTAADLDARSRHPHPLHIGYASSQNPW